MEVTALCSDYVGLAQPTRLAEVCRRMCRRVVDPNRVIHGKIAIVFSGLIRVEGIHGAQDRSNYLVGKGEKGRGV